MDSEIDLLRAIVADPENMSLRLVAADWYEDQGDPRAEFIRIQLRLAEGELKSAERRILLRREKALLQRHRRLWNGEIHRFLNGTPLAGQIKSRRLLVRGWGYKRGFVESIYCRGSAWASHSRTLVQIGPILDLRLCHARDSACELAQCEYLPNLRSLDLSGCLLGHDALVPVLQNLGVGKLKKLDLSQNNLNSSTIAYLLGTRRDLVQGLTELRLYGNYLDTVIAELRNTLGPVLRFGDEGPSNPLPRWPLSSLGDWLTSWYRG